ncbi:glycosyltransferase [Flavivirga jejuensis]|uniref:Glycosyltransferase n=1 Tax=Flavivirga jejuensis TaxID=870487 RepID=A0ABT8WUH5_9FLAO|nr:glycosyltransferase [Flavivirga jejuensis]MDO5976645.1 glycosyltransferase [Flavivirga jejuensis]
MRVLQLIDSLNAGGAERVAVNLANALSNKIEASFLCATRKEGLLKENLSNTVNYLFLNKTKTVDVGAIKRLNKFIKENKIQIIHAHSTSFFLAAIMKLFNRDISIIWHDHYGNSDFLQNRKFDTLKFCSKYFSHIFSVNRSLEAWAKQKLKIKAVSYLPNFAIMNKTLAVTDLKYLSGKRIVCLANLRPQKDHFTLLNAFKKVVELYPDWTLHCVGEDFNDDYSKSVKNKIDELDLNDSVSIYGSKSDVFNILSQCEIGILSSKSEGLPLALLEYGLSNLAVISTKVGECETLITNNDNGLLVEATKPDELSKAISLYIENVELRHTHASNYNKHILKNYSEKVQLQTILKTYINCIS